MASWNRLIHDSRGRIFVPMNVDASSENDSFLTPQKGVTIFGVIFSYIALAVWGSNVGLTVFGWIILIALLTFLNQFLVRYIVFQEPYFYAIWKREKAMGTPKASRFWSIASFRKGAMGDVMVFQDLKVGVIVELERDTIIGRAADNREKHYDALSECYRTAFGYGLRVVKMDLMEPAGKDERFNELSDLASRATNPNIQKLLEINTGYMRSIGSTTLDERDYLLFYSPNINKMETILKEALESVSCLMEGSYVGAKVLTESEIYQLPRENFNVKFFDGVEAQMSVYRGSGIKMKPPIKITQIEFENGKKVTLDAKLNARLSEAVKLLSNEQIEYSDWDVIKALNGVWSNQYIASINKLHFDDGEVLTIGDDSKPGEVVDNLHNIDIGEDLGNRKAKRFIRDKSMRSIIRGRKNKKPKAEVETTDNIEVSKEETEKNFDNDDEVLF